MGTKRTRKLARLADATRNSVTTSPKSYITAENARFLLIFAFMFPLRI